MRRSESGCLSITRVLLDVDHIGRIKETLRKKFADLANNFEKRLRAISSELAGIEGTLEVHPSENIQCYCQLTYHLLS